MVESKRNSNPEPASSLQDAFLSAPFAAQLLPPLRRFFSQHSVALIGFSGGADSAMLLYCSALVAADYGAELHVLHVHHGLDPDAEYWAQHCQSFCETLDLDLRIQSVTVNRNSGLGIEAAARTARYRAFSEFAQSVSCSQVLLAHHADDQAETVLLRLLRGAGAVGLGAMSDSSQRLGLTFHRPWLGLKRAWILQAAQCYAQYTGWQAVEDSSNVNPHYRRGAVRCLLTPVLDQHWPAWKNNLNRHSRLMQENTLLLNDLAELDFTGLAPSVDQRSFSLLAWRGLTPHRQANVLRYFMLINGLSMPTQARLNEWLKQLNQVHQMGSDRHVLLKHQNHILRIYEARVCLLTE